MKKAFIGILLMVLVAIACNQTTVTEVDKNSASEENVSKPIAKVNSKNISQGQKLFILCSACHSLKNGEPHKVGPSLYGVFGKKAGTQEGFKYTDELKNSNIVWSKETLRAWLEDPAGYIPGTSMAFVGVKEKERQDILLDYLMNETKAE